MKTKKAILVLSVLAIASVLPAQASMAGKLRAGNRAYKNGKYDKALDLYRQAQIEQPNATPIQYNIGNALHKAQDFEEAEKAYQRVLTVKDPLLKSRALYNLGNNAYRQDKTDEALDYYKQALALNPKDQDAKFNIEFLMNRQQMEQKDQKNGKSKNSNNKKDKNKNGKNDQNDQQQKGNQKEQPAAAEQDKKKGMNKDDAQRILEYYNDAEKNAAEKRKMRQPSLPQVEEDW
jgi:Ca-activated chloride channel family protein